MDDSKPYTTHFLCYGSRVFMDRGVTNLVMRLCSLVRLGESYRPMIFAMGNAVVAFGGTKHTYLVFVRKRRKLTRHREVPHIFNGHKPLKM